MAQSTKSMYKQAFDKYALFMGKSFDLFPISVSNLANFIAHLHLSGYKASTISSTVAGLAYFHNILGFSNPSQHIIIRKLLKGASKLTHTPDIRLPISKSILRSIVLSIPYLFNSIYDQILYTSC